MTIFRLNFLLQGAQVKMLLSQNGKIKYTSDEASLNQAANHTNGEKPSLVD